MKIFNNFCQILNTLLDLDVLFSHRQNFNNNILGKYKFFIKKLLYQHIINISLYNAMNLRNIQIQLDFNQYLTLNIIMFQLD